MQDYGDMEIKYVGTVKLSCGAGDEMERVILTDVAYIPSARTNLFFLSAMQKGGLSVEFPAFGGKFMVN